jgi:hypothetical protein
MKAASTEEVAFDKPNQILDRAFLLWAIGPAGYGNETAVNHKLPEAFVPNYLGLTIWVSDA